MSHQDEIADGEEIARDLRHLLAFHQQEARMHPEMHERLPGQRLRLRDLVFVMREDEVFAAGMNVEALAEVFHRHLRTLDVPARATGTDLGFPHRLAWFRRLPDR